MEYYSDAYVKVINERNQIIETFLHEIMSTITDAPLTAIKNKLIHEIHRDSPQSVDGIEYIDIYKYMNTDTAELNIVLMASQLVVEEYHNVYVYIRSNYLDEKIQKIYLGIVAGVE